MYVLPHSYVRLPVIIELPGLAGKAGDSGGLSYPAGLNRLLASLQCYRIGTRSAESHNERESVRNGKRKAPPEEAGQGLVEVQGGLLLRQALQTFSHLTNAHLPQLVHGQSVLALGSCPPSFPAAHSQRADIHQEGHLLLSEL